LQCKSSETELARASLDDRNQYSRYGTRAGSVRWVVCCPTDRTPYRSDARNSDDHRYGNADTNFDKYIHANTYRDFHDRGKRYHERNIQ